MPRPSKNTFQVNDKIGNLTLIEKITIKVNTKQDKRGYQNRSGWLCLCVCGKTTTVLDDNLKRKNTLSCGCLKWAEKHGCGKRKNRHKLYSVWNTMKQRCNNPNTAKYKDYGARGITYDPKWESFEGFFADMGPSWKEGLSIDRINVDGNYCKDNCRWATAKQQANNKRNSHL